MTIKKRVPTAEGIVERLVADALARGYKIKVSDEAGHDTSYITDYPTAISELGYESRETLFFYRGSKFIGTAFLDYEKGVDVLNDYSNSPPMLTLVRGANLRADHLRPGAL